MVPWTGPARETPAAPRAMTSRNSRRVTSDDRGPHTPEHWHLRVMTRFPRAGVYTPRGRPVDEQSAMLAHGPRTLHPHYTAPQAAPQEGDATFRSSACPSPGTHRPARSPWFPAWPSGTLHVPSDRLITCPHLYTWTQLGPGECLTGLVGFLDFEGLLGRALRAPHNFWPKPFRTLPCA